jgi:hypothetical protein
VLLAVLRGETAAPGGLASGREPVWPRCPYLGLVPFGERDERVFYGRGELVNQLPQLAVGALGPGSQRWPRRVIQPAGGPVRESA